MKYDDAYAVCDSAFRRHAMIRWDNKTSAERQLWAQERDRRMAEFTEEKLSEAGL